MSKSSPTLDFRERRLSLQSSQELIIALMVTAATYTQVPIPIFFAPFIVIFAFALMNRPTPEFRAVLAQNFELPKTIMLRMTSGYSSKLYSAPFFAVLFVPYHKAEFIKNPWNLGELHHEIGHHKQFDMAAITWLALAGVVWLTLFIQSLPDGIHTMAKYLAGDFERGHVADIPLIDENGGFYVPLMMLTIAAIIFASLQRLFHNREYLADIRGYCRDKETVSEFIKTELRREERPTGNKNWLIAIKDNLSHPSFRSRYNKLMAGLDDKMAPVFIYAMIWGFSTMTVLVFWGLQAGRSSILAAPDASLIFYSSVLAAIFIICAVGYFTDRITFDCGYKHPQKTIFILSIGYFSGYFLSTMHYILFVYFSGVTLSESAGKDLLSLSIVPAYIFFWISLNALTCSFFSLIRKRNAFRFGYSFLNFLAAGGCLFAVFSPLLPLLEGKSVPVETLQFFAIMLIALLVLPILITAGLSSAIVFCRKKFLLLITFLGGDRSPLHEI